MPHLSDPHNTGTAFELGGNEALLPTVVKNRVFQTQPYATVVSPEGQLHNVTYAELENASNRAAWLLDDLLPSDEDQFYYMGGSDLRHIALVLGAMKTGKCIIFPSPANTMSANLQFFKSVEAKTLIYAPESVNSLGPLLEAAEGEVRLIEGPSLQALVRRDPVKEFPFKKSWDEIRDVSFMGLHTSGTSGHPKPILWTHAAVRVLGSHVNPTLKRRVGPSAWGEATASEKLFCGFPFFHMAGIGPALGAIYCNTTMVMQTPGMPLTPDNIAAILRYSEATVTLMPPSLLENMLTSSSALQALKRLKHVAYMGGPMNPVRGAQLAKQLRSLLNIFGSTEGGASWQFSSGDSTRWNALKFYDLGQRMEEVSPGVYELVLPDTEISRSTMGYFHTMPHLRGSELRTQDLFSPAGSKDDGWWIYRGRVDNWLAMSNGLKFDPAEMEGLIAAHPDVKGVMVAGEHRFRLCLIIEMWESRANQERETETSLSSLLPTIHKANMEVPKYARCPPELVMFAKTDKAFLRSSKGTIQRRLTVTAYEADIDEMYDRAEQGFLSRGLPPLNGVDTVSLAKFLRRICAEILDVDTLCADDDLFANGLDSHSAQMIVARLKAGLRSYGCTEPKVQKVNVRLLYSRSSVGDLAIRFSQVLSGSLPSNSDHDIYDAQLLLKQYEKEVRRTSSLEAPSVGTASTRGAVGMRSIILTGSTGCVGSYILASLLTQFGDAKIICLNRSDDAKSKQVASFRARGLCVSSLADDRIVFLTADLASDQLGLSESDYSMLTGEAATIIHNSFPVNFLLPVRSFEPQFKSIVNLIRLANCKSRNTEIVFLSSIAAALTVRDGHGSIPEAVLEPEKVKNILPQGYAQAKFICEHLLNTFSKISGRKTTILRVGQVAGPLLGSGIWSPQEWLPSLVLSSKHIGVAPDSIGQPVNWIPVDELGRIISELVDDAHHRGMGRRAFVYNVVNPTRTPWTELLPALHSVAHGTVSAAEWIARLEKSKVSSSHKVGINPGIKLLDFYKMTMLDDTLQGHLLTTNLVTGSLTAARMAPIKMDNLLSWMNAWMRAV